MRHIDFPRRGPLRGAAALCAVTSALIFSPGARAQGGLPPGAAATVRAGMSRPRITGIGPAKGVTMGPGPCFVRDAGVILTGGDFGATADGRRLMAYSRGVAVALVPVFSWAPHRIDARLDLGVAVEGESITLDLLDAHGDSATLGGSAPFLVCYRDQTLLGGTVRVPACSSERREFLVVASGPGHLEKSVVIAPHAGAATYAFPSLPMGSWAVSVGETHRPALPGHPVLHTGAPGSIQGCNAVSIGFDPATQTILIADGRRRASGVDFIEMTIALPPISPPDFRGAIGQTPTPNPVVVPLSALPMVHVPPTVTPTATPTR